MKNRHFEAIESEIRKEKAEALGRVGERLECALQALEMCRRDLLDLVANRPDGVVNDGRGVPSYLHAKLAEHARLEEQARYLRACLIIQREAMGLRRHDDVDRQYPPLVPLTLPILIRDEGGP